MTTNGCAAVPTIENADNDPDDGTSLTIQTHTGCKDNSRVTLYTINGGGHTWPQGNQYLPESKIGPTTQEINANELMVNFFANSQ